MKRFFVLSCLLFSIVNCISKNNHPKNLTLNYIEYNRGKSFPLQADIRMVYADHDLRFHRVFLEDESFFPDDSIIPNAFLKPLLRLNFGDALKAFTEPYYGYRFLHFFKKNPHWGIGIEFIHHKVFLDPGDQRVRVTGSRDGVPVDDVVSVGDYIDYFSVSHGINHLSLALVYRLLLSPSEKIPDGRLQPFVTVTAGPAIPHLEVKLAEDPSQWAAYSFQSGFRNWGLGAGVGLRCKPFRHLGFFLEYKLTYSHLHGMHFDDGEESRVMMDFLTHHLQWGISYMF